MQRFFAFVCFLAGIYGHGILTNPPPRDGTQVAGGNKGRNRGPCGNPGAGGATATLTAGDKLTVQWDVGIAHGGDCSIGIGLTDDAAADNAGQVFSCADNRGDEDMEITIPEDSECAGADSCVLRWFWTGDGPYYDCADIVINAAAAPPVITPPGGSNNNGGSGSSTGIGGSALSAEGDGEGGGGGSVIGIVIVLLLVLWVVTCIIGKAMPEKWPIAAKVTAGTVACFGGLCAAATGGGKPATAPTGEVLPKGWKAVKDPSSGKYYYVNKATNTTQWTPPEGTIPAGAAPPAAGAAAGATPPPAAAAAPPPMAAAPPPADAPLPEGWTANVDAASGHTYYLHTSGESTWTKPVGNSRV